MEKYVTFLSTFCLFLSELTWNLIGARTFKLMPCWWPWPSCLWIITAWNVMYGFPLIHGIALWHNGDPLSKKSIFFAVTHARRARGSGHLYIHPRYPRGRGVAWRETFLEVVKLHHRYRRHNSEKSVSSRLYAVNSSIKLRHQGALANFAMKRG